VQSFKLPTRAEFPVALTKVSTPSALLRIFGDWLWVAASIAVATRYPGALTFLAAQIVVAARQHAFFLHMHEATHDLVSKNRAWNDRISNWLAAWPVGFSTERYRVRHWTHHRYLNTDRDPDWVRKKHDPAWEFPMSAPAYWRKGGAYLVGKGVPEMFYALRAVGITTTDLPRVIPYYALCAAALTAAGAWKGFALFWILPYFTVLPFLHRVRNATDHLALPKSHGLNGSRNIASYWGENFLFGPHGCHYHLVHHLHPFVPAYRLRAAHEFLRKNEAYREHAYANGSYFLSGKDSAYADLTKKAA
jgi:fatty acid desaturase